MLKVLLIKTNLVAFHNLLAKFLEASPVEDVSFFLSKSSRISCPAPSTSRIKANRRASEPYLSINSIGSIPLPELLLIFLLFSSPVSAVEDLTSKKLLCPKLLWGFEFISSNKVRVFNTDINQKTNIKEYYYETDLELSYVNLYLIEINIRNIVYSINLNTFRVDIWTMTSGGNTTREMIPIGFCEIVKIDNIFDHIKSLKNN